MRKPIIKVLLIAGLVGFGGIILYLVLRGDPLSAVAVSGVASVFFWFLLGAGKPL